MSKRPLDPARRSFLRAAGVLGAAVAFGAGAGSPAPNVSPAQLPASGASLGPGAQAGGRQDAEANAGEIPRRPLGRAGAQVSALGVGGHHLGDLPTVDEAIRLVHEAIDAGVTFFDNCWEYYNGKTET
jgi:hypothetical protein